MKKEISKPVYYTKGTLGDAFLIVCKLYHKASEEEIVCKHFTVHKELRGLIKDVFALLPNVEVEFVNNKHKGVIVSGDFINVDKEKNAYKFKVNLFPKFDEPDMSRFKLFDNYVVVQLSAGARSKRAFKKGFINKLINEKRNIVLVGNDDIKMATKKNILDLRNKTSISEVLAIIKNASAFYGCQGLLSFMAISQRVPSYLLLLNESDKMAIRNRVDVFKEWKKYYKGEPK